MKKTIIVIIVAVLIALGYYLIRPLFVDDVVDESFPEAVMSPDDPNFIQIPPQEELDQMSEETKNALELSITQKMADMPDDVMEESMPEPETANPEVVLLGSFQDADSFHKGSGDAAIYALADGSNVLRLENFEVTNGPDLYVYLVAKQNPSESEVEGDFVNLGRLKGNKGNQNYAIPQEIDLDAYQSIVIWCQAFSVLFSTANLN
jgi:hypothetical protein